MNKPNFEPESGVTRQEFFEWLNTCLSDWQIVEDEYGETVVRFSYHEESEGEDE